MWTKLTASCLAIAVVSLVVVRIACAIDETHEGKVVKVTKDTITVLDRRDNDNDTFAVTGQTTITYNGKSAKLIDIQVGDQAKVIGADVAGKLVAKEIHATSPQ